MRISSEYSSDLITPGTNPTTLGHSLTSFCTDKYLFTVLTSRGFSKTDLYLSVPQSQFTASTPAESISVQSMHLHRASQSSAERQKPAFINAGNASVTSSNQFTYPHSCRMHKGSWPSVQLHCLVFC